MLNFKKGKINLNKKNSNKINLLLIGDTVNDIYDKCIADMVEEDGCQ